MQLPPTKRHSRHSQFYCKHYRYMVPFSPFMIETAQDSDRPYFSTSENLPHGQRKGFPGRASSSTQLHIFVNIKHPSILSHGYTLTLSSLPRTLLALLAQPLPLPMHSAHLNPKKSSAETGTQKAAYIINASAFTNAPPAVATIPLFLAHKPPLGVLHIHMPPSGAHHIHMPPSGAHHIHMPPSGAPPVHLQKGNWSHPLVYSPHW